MQTYIVRVYRAHPTDAGSVSGVIDYIESGHKEPFHGINGLESLLAHSILEDQIEIPSFMAGDEGIHGNVDVI